MDAINSVQFSNHSHYPHLKGQVLESEDLRTLYEGLKLNDLNKRYTHLLTGYARSQSFLETVHEVVQHVKSLNPNALYGNYLFLNSKNITNLFLFITNFYLFIYHLSLEHNIFFLKFTFGFFSKVFMIFFETII